MKPITENYHLPDNAFWTCSDRYNGLASIERFIQEERSNVRMSEVLHSSKLKNISISSRIAKQL